MSLGKYKIIAYCCAKLHNEPQTQFFDVLRKAVVGTDCRLVSFCSFNDCAVKDSDAVGAQSVFDICNYEAVDLMIISPMSIKDPEVIAGIVDRCRMHNVPVLTLEERYGDLPLLCFDLLASFEIIVRHIVEFHNCKTINVMAGMRNNSYSDERIAVVKRVLEEKGLKLEDDRIMYGDFWADPTEKSMEDFISSGKQLPDAIICCNDTMAIKVCEVLDKHGILVPEQIIVTGFDGIEFEKVASPRLTTAGNNYEAVAEYIRKLITSGDIKANMEHTVMLSNSIIYSESCGCKSTNLHNTTVNLVNFYNKYHMIYEYQIYLSKFLTAMTDSAGSDSFRSRIQNYILEDMWVCFNSKLRLTEHIASDKNKMSVYMRRESGRNFNESVKNFPKAEMIPDYENVFERTYSVAVIPIHFLDVQYGYIVKEPSNDVYDFHMLMMLEAQFEQGVEMVSRHMKLNEVNTKLSTLYLQDSMTGIYNRRGFYKKISKEFRDNTECYVGVVGVDMDGLKGINDGFGHASGDRALMAISDAMSKAADKNTICARFGGDEFEVAVISRENIEEVVDGFIERMLDGLDRYNKANYSKNKFMVEISYGCCCEKISRLEDIDKIISAADTKMYTQKTMRKHGGIR